MRNPASLAVIRYARGATKCGNVFAATTERGLCQLHFVETKDSAASLAELRRRFPGAILQEDGAALAEVFRHLEGWMTGEEQTDLALDLGGTRFQQQVWEALRRVPAGTTISYSELARRAGYPKAVRATASACARNPVALFVPCHRIVRRDGGIGGYGGGLDNKRRLLELEGAVMPV